MPKPDPPSEATTTSWIALNSAYTRAHAAIESALKEAGLPPLSWYDVLLELDRGERDGLRLHEIERRLLLPQSGTSRLIRKLEDSGLVQREACTDDGRGFLISLTTDGRRLRRKMWPVYAGALKDAIESRITPHEAKILGSLLERIGISGS